MLYNWPSSFPSGKYMVLLSNKSLIIIVLCFTSVACKKTSCKDVTKERLYELVYNSNKWKEVLTDYHAKPFSEIKRMYFKYNLTYPQMKRELNMIEQCLDNSFSEKDSISYLLDTKDKLVVSFYTKCDSFNVQVSLLLKVETRIEQMLQKSLNEL